MPIRHSGRSTEEGWRQEALVGFLSLLILKPRQNMIKCTLFSKSIAHVAREFRVGDAQAIVLADANKLKVEMESNDVYYYNAARVEMHKGLFKKGMFEVPLVAPRGVILALFGAFHA